jgi:hypothetical protein
MLRLYLLLFLLATFAGIGYSAYYYYTWSQNTIITLRENNVKLAQAAETLQNTVKRMEADTKQMEALNRELSANLKEAESGLDRLRKRFTQIDITKQALEDPSGLETRINNAVNRLITDLEEKTTSTPADSGSTAE